MVLIEYNILGNLCASFFLCMEASCHKAWTSCGGPTGGESYWKLNLLHLTAAYVHNMQLG